MFADAYVEPVVVDVLDTKIVSTLVEIQSGQLVPEYTVQCFQDNDTDLTPFLQKDSSDQLRWDCTANVLGSVTLTLDALVDLRWGSVAVHLYQLIRSVEYNAAHGQDAATWMRFSLGWFVLTSPGLPDLDNSDVRTVTGFDLNYLLQNQPADVFSFAPGSTYLAAVTAVFRAANLIVTDLSEVCDYPGDWDVKVLPDSRTIPLDSGSTYLDIVNDLLKASGCRPISVQPNKRWLVLSQPDATQQALRWRWAASDDPSLTDADLDVKVVIRHQSAYNGDVYNVPNQWVFVQQGLTFKPVEGSGQYTVNNTTVPPTDQTSVGRVIRSNQFLDASGQADLTTQGKAIVLAQLSAVEQITLTTAAWPAARTYDIFQVTHSALPGSPVRRVQAQSWMLPLWGDPMQWSTNVVASL